MTFNNNIEYLGRQNDGRYSIAPVEQASHPPISAPEAEEG